MILDEDDRTDLPRRLFALAGRRAEHAVAAAASGEARNAPTERLADLSAMLHDAGQDLQVIADAIVALVQQGRSQ